MKLSCQVIKVTVYHQLIKKSYGWDTQNRTVWDGSSSVRPVSTSINRIELPFFHICTFPCLWFPLLLSLWPFLSPLSHFIGRCSSFFPFAGTPPPPPPNLPNYSPLKSLLPIQSLLFPSHPLCYQLQLLLSLTPLVTSAAPTIQPVLNRNALDITSVCLLSTQSARTAIFWFVGKGARVSKLAQNSLNDSALPN